MSRSFYEYCGLHFLLVMLAAVTPTSLVASQNSSAVAGICDSAAELVSRESGVPLDVLRAITLTETGRGKGTEFRPWPWTVNMEGAGRWFANLSDAQYYVDRHFARGARSFDVGCFQINYRWHGNAFTSIEQMFDPISNARYAARFLTELYAELGDWSEAAGAYHSRTPKYAKKYKARFDRIRSRLSKTQPDIVMAEFDPPRSEVPAPRANNFPLLQAGAAAESVGSLVPLRSSRRRFIDVQSTRPLHGEHR